MSENNVVKLPRCTCAEVYGEDPRCTMHGNATQWAIVNTTPEEWQDQAVNSLETIDMMDGKLAALRADKATIKARGDRLAAVLMRIMNIADGEEGNAFIAEICDEALTEWRKL